MGVDHPAQCSHCQIPPEKLDCWTLTLRIYAVLHDERRSMPRRLVLCLTAALILLANGARLIAARITFTFSATGTGWLKDGPSASEEPFTNAPFTITATADTSNIVTIFPGILAVPNIGATIDVAGVGSGAFLFPTRTFVSNNLPGALGFSKMDFPPSPTNGSDLIDFHSSSFLTYQLNTSLGPVLDPAPFTRFHQFRDIALSFGLLSFNDNYVNGTFVATVPEPSDLRIVLSSCVAALIALRTWSSRRRTKAID